MKAVGSIKIFVHGCKVGGKFTLPLGLHAERINLTFIHDLLLPEALPRKTSEKAHNETYYFVY